MSIVTRTGDQGTTGLMYNRRVPKSHPRVEAYGCVDELNAALGLARAASPHDFVRAHLESIQKDLIVVMGELATDPQDLARYIKDGFLQTGPELTARLDALATELEAGQGPLKGWAIPGESMAAATLDMARTACRRAERQVCALHDAQQLHNSEVIIFLNRLADVLWLLARWVERQRGNANACRR